MAAICIETSTAEDALRNGWLFSACPEEELREIAELCAVADVPAGELLLRERERIDSCYVVVHGQATVTRAGRRIGHAGAGDVIGATALIGDGTANVTAVAASDMCLLVLERRLLTGYLTGRGWSVRHRLDVLNAEKKRPARVAGRAA